MDTDIWLPLVTLLGGWGLAQVTEVLKDWRASNRDRLARRSELQRTTLLALQDQLLEVFKLTARGPVLEAEARTQLRHATATGRLLASRVEHDDVRKEARVFLKASVRLARPNADDMTEEEIRRATDMFTDATDLIGMLLRERY
jgi:hypothetical protein